MRENNAKIQAFAARVGFLWCEVMHDAPMWPIHGRYECRKCGRHHAVPWAEQAPRSAPPVRVGSAASRFQPASV